MTTRNLETRKWERGTRNSNGGSGTASTLPSLFRVPRSTFPVDGEPRVP